MSWGMQLLFGGGRQDNATTQLDQALWTIEVQELTINTQREHIKALDARIAKLEHEAVGLRSLILEG